MRRSLEAFAYPPYHVIFTYTRPNEIHHWQALLVGSSGTAGSSSAVTAVTNFLLA